MLLPCRRLWGTATLIASDPVAVTIRNALFLPTHESVFLDRYAGWGLYDAEGRLVDEAGYFRLPDRHRIGQSETLAEFPRAETVPDGEYVYGGPVIMHYGHFVTTALARLWPLVRGGLPPGAKIVVHSHQSPDQWFAHDYVRTIFGALGLGAHDFAVFREPVRLPRILVPRPAIEEQNFVHRVFGHLCATVARAIGAPAVEPSGPIYLSKTRMRHGTARLLNEAGLEARLEALGVRIVHPETLPFVDQVAALSGASAVLGTVGSGFHTTLFSGHPRRLIALAYGDELNANFRLIDRLVGNDATYVHCPGTAEMAVADSTFAFTVPDPVAVADELFHLQSRH